MAAVLAEGETTIGNAACEPRPGTSAGFLVGRGARIHGIGSNLLRIEGVERLGSGEHTIGSDYIEVASFVGLAAVTGGELAVEGVIEDDRPVEVGYRLGLAWELDGDRALESPRPGHGGRGRPRPGHPDDRRRPLAGVPGRPDLDRGRGRHPGQGPC